MNAASGFVLAGPGQKPGFGEPFSPIPDTKEVDSTQR
jgi:hypothetical protein